MTTILQHHLRCPAYKECISEESEENGTQMQEYEKIRKKKIQSELQRKGRKQRKWGMRKNKRGRWEKDESKSIVKWWRQGYITQETESLSSIQLLYNTNHRYKQPLSALLLPCCFKRVGSFAHTFQVLIQHKPWASFIYVYYYCDLLIVVMKWPNIL